ncbi:SMC-Scp complex subunit ScpB [Macrococcoides bohemicum]|uniref:SMC-Scp complex subunit ScpB n=1 Tax=Macrococcoides bohemicum TaxID=1903056 RepID=A0A328A7Q4_9STAP|nr:SMC-Scp complex subunit ScpB [Macrococcus bohemicus]MBC9873288.1 SMC-Scp complex subunit ScpB [Macrococcus bohemicus]QRN50006.1 SMC-Scp complex subunit ScpB [Macrococcus bohemicus]QYA41446.1 SMC-Scp complex subunit ScpB [Macrococcus bohemicus]QYA43870.1 SMC-Scp complex subunit ScpB [Macrococcus bohemicus]RAK50417.1 SMC-Scp complex subunit ScpB [Macrococcus bohemicus]
MSNEKINIILGLLYAVGDEGIEIEQLAEIIERTPSQLSDIVSTYNHEIFEIQKLGSKYFLMTNETLNPYLEDLVTATNEKKLTQASLETLAIIAYNQPVTRHDIEMMRGVNSDGPVKTLIERGLVESTEVNGERARQLATTEFFLMTFGLTSLDDLPRDETMTSDASEMELFFKNLNEEDE